MPDFVFITDGNTTTRVVRSAFERVWSKRGWELVEESTGDSPPSDPQPSTSEPQSGGRFSTPTVSDGETDTD